MDTKITTALLNAILLTASTAANATFPGTNGKIAYINGEPKISSINANGTGLVEIATPLPAVQYGLRFSPDGGQILYVGRQRRPPRFCDNLYVINVDGTGNTQLTTSCDGSEEFSWSPDGLMIAFTHNRSIWVMNADGSGKTALGVAGGAPNWSPDGTKIAFHNFQYPGGTNIFVMNSDGTGVTQLTFVAPGNDFFYPNWSPDGTKIAFDGYNDGSEILIRVINADGTGLAALTNDWGRFPSWSPDGRKIVYFGSSDTGGVIKTINANGSGQRTISSTGDFPDWGPAPAEKITICHTRAQQAVTVNISQNALPAHMGHGDTIGACPN